MTLKEVRKYYANNQAGTTKALDKTIVSDELLWQEIFSLREKLKIAVEAIKSYEPEFDAQLFTQRLNSTDYDQLMEELSGDAETKPAIEEIERAIDWMQTGKYETQVGDNLYEADSRFHPDTARFRQTILAALRSHQPPPKPVPEEGR